MTQGRGGKPWPRGPLPRRALGGAQATDPRRHTVDPRSTTGRTTRATGWRAQRLAAWQRCSDRRSRLRISSRSSAGRRPVKRSASDGRRAWRRGAGRRVAPATDRHAAGATGPVQLPVRLELDRDIAEQPARLERRAADGGAGGGLGVMKGRRSGELTDELLPADGTTAAGRGRDRRNSGTAPRDPHSWPWNSNGVHGPSSKKRRHRPPPRPGWSHRSAGGPLPDSPPGRGSR